MRWALALEALHEGCGKRPTWPAHRDAGAFLLQRLRVMRGLAGGVAGFAGVVASTLLQGEGLAGIATLAKGYRSASVDWAPVPPPRGLSPKRYARLMRIARSRELIKGRDGRVLTDTAHAAGYYDQAHFIHDFKAVTGLTPGVPGTRETAVRSRSLARKRRRRITVAIMWVRPPTKPINVKAPRGARAISQKKPIRATPSTAK
ncbi:AraC family transcriptional regulator [Billgrantia gudaonensis]|uniref:AraC family transcriptional regulator n=1 Tax=Billgrantia gudaonensis TaxID=376427 RepID=A0A3S0VSI9_9GAMM|nr:AraC family transcriptional regulator [Halomonas gudaonensis]